MRRCGEVVFFDSACNCGTSIHEVNLIGKSVFESWSQEGIMGAAENDDVGICRDHFGGVFIDGILDIGTRKDSCFHKIDKAGAGTGDDTEVAGVLGDEMMKFFTCE